MHQSHPHGNGPQTLSPPPQFLTWTNTGAGSWPIDLFTVYDAILAGGANKTNRTIHWIEIYPVDSVIHLLNNWAQHCWKKPLNSVYLPIFLLKTNEDMVCKIVKFFIDACIVEPQFVSPNIQISVCKILQSFIFAGFRWQVHEFEGALKLSSGVTGNSHSLIKNQVSIKIAKNERVYIGI